MTRVEQTERGVRAGTAPATPRQQGRSGQAGYSLDTAKRDSSNRGRLGFLQSPTTVILPVLRPTEPRPTCGRPVEEVRRVTLRVATSPQPSQPLVTLFPEIEQSACTDDAEGMNGLGTEEFFRLALGEFGARHEFVNRAAVISGLNEEGNSIEHEHPHALGARLTLFDHLIEDRADVFERARQDEAADRTSVLRKGRTIRAERQEESLFLLGREIEPPAP